MNTTRVGRIAHLPRDIRELLNNRLLDGESARGILPLLNSLPAVTEILVKHFDTHPISDQNLSEWRQGGFREWMALTEDQRLRRLAQLISSKDDSEPESPAPANHVANSNPSPENSAEFDPISAEPALASTE